MRTAMSAAAQQAPLQLNSSHVPYVHEQASPAQLVVITVIESVVFQFNRNILCTDQFHITDTGGTIVIHLFGAYFGLACALVLGAPPQSYEPSSNARPSAPPPLTVRRSRRWSLWRPGGSVP